MRINESKKMSLQLAETAIETTEKSIQFTEENLDTLNMKGEEEENEQEELEQTGKKNVDPSPWLNRKERKIYDRLSDRKKKQYVKAAMKKKEAVERAVYSQSGKSTVENTAWNTKQMSGTGVKQTSGIKKTSGTAATIGQTAGKTGQTIGKAGAKTAVKAAGGAATVGATVGVEVAVTAGKKTAETFKSALEAKSLAAEENLGKMRQQLEEKRKNSQEKGGISSVATSAGVVMLLPMISMMQMALSVAVSLIGALASVLLALVAVALPLIIIVVLFLFPNSSGTGAERIVEVALTQENSTDGSPYWEYTMGSDFVDGHSTPWCACFVSWCAAECGFIDDELFPKSGSVATYRRFYREKGLLHEEDDYVPKMGDLILFGDDAHIGIVQYVIEGFVVTIEGNTSDAVHTRMYTLNNPRITGYCTPAYPGGVGIPIPEGMGVHHTYMGWHTVTSKTSLQYQLREDSGENYDEEGFARIGDRYVIACTTTFGKVGDYVDFYRENGEVVHAVIGDIKNQNDPGCNEYGHNDGRCVVEYIVSKSWYPSHANPGTAGCHPEWDSRIVKGVNLGINYFD